MNFSSKIRAARMVAVIVATLAGIVGISVSPAQAYVPGKASVSRPVYNAYTGAWDYGCSFTNWRSGAKVVYHCELWVYPPGKSASRLEDTNGSWTPNPTYRNVRASEHVVMGLGNMLCVRARAYSVDGGVTTPMPKENACYFV